MAAECLNKNPYGHMASLAHSMLSVITPQRGLGIRAAEQPENRILSVRALYLVHQVCKSAVSKAALRDESATLDSLHITLSRSAKSEFSEWDWTT